MLGPLRDVELGSVALRPRERAVAGRSGTVAVEPLVMRLALALARRAGQTVERAALFRLCWGDAPVGDDSLNRVIAALRRALREAGGADVVVETVPATGYVLRFADSGLSAGQADAEAANARRAAFDSWRAAFPEPD